MKTTKEYESDVNNLKVDIEGIRKDIKYIKENFQSVNKCLNGNGQPGIMQRVSSLETFRDKINGALIILNILWAVLLYIINVL